MRASRNFRHGSEKITPPDPIPTAECPPFPEGLAEAKRILPVPNLEDREIDALLRQLQRRGAAPTQLPATQYGRRLVIAAAIELAKKPRPTP